MHRELDIGEDAFRVALMHALYLAPSSDNVQIPTTDGSPLSFDLYRHAMIRTAGFPFLRNRGATALRLCRWNVRGRHSSNHAEPQAAQKQRSRAERITLRLPKFLQKYTVSLVNAPVAHITAFLILHELTAVVPLLGLAGLFHYSQWMPPYISEGKWVSDGVEKFGTYFRKKGWLGHDASTRYRWWGRGEGSVRIVVEYVHSLQASNSVLS